jgi:DNA end-binding protein Ku
MATIWKGSVAFGLVNIPVELKPAVRSDNISFRLLHAEDLSPVRYERVCEADGEVVPWREIVKGYEYAKGKFVVLTDEDFKAAALEQSKTIEILDFVKEEEIDPRFFETPYYLVPSKGAEKGYALLREAIRTSEVVGIGKVVIRQSQHLAAVRVVEDALVLELMRFHAELVDSDDYAFPKAELVRPQELAMAEQLVANLAEPFDPEKYDDDYRANLMRVIRAKMKGKRVRLEAEDEEPQDAKVLDLMSRLQASLGKTGGRAKRPSGRGAAKGGGARKVRVKAAARKRSARTAARRRSA